MLYIIIIQALIGWTSTCTRHYLHSSMWPHTYYAQLYIIILDVEIIMEPPILVME